MKSVKKYIIEFFVIVLGVSVSFLAEQWRQDINTRQERDELVEKARKEIQSFLKNDSLNQPYSPEVFLKKIITKKSTANIDSFILALPNLTHSGEITHRLPNTVLVAQRRDIDPELGEYFQYINETLEAMKEIDDDSKKIINNELWDLFDKYEITNDLMKYQERVVGKLRQGTYQWDMIAMLKEVEKQGNYSGFFKDKQAQKNLKEIYSNLLENVNAVLLIKAYYLEIEKILSKEKH